MAVKEASGGANAGSSSLDLKRPFFAAFAVKAFVRKARQAFAKNAK
jgi:hypothetical protein